MSTNRKVVYLLGTLAGIFYSPYITSYIKYGGKFPEGKFRFPPLEPLEKSMFSIWIFIIIAIIFFIVILLFLFPKLFGFKHYFYPEQKKEIEKPKLPAWFYAGLLMWLGSLLVLCLKTSEPRWLVNWAVLPLFWGFAMMLDGWVYIRNHGISLISSSLREFLGIGMVSISGWLIFEYLNLFININWYYPHAGLLNHDEFLLYAVVGSSGLMPMAFEWYLLLRTVPVFRNRYRKGPRIRGSIPLKNILLVVSFIGLLAAPFFPNLLFFILWLAPMIILTVVLEKLGLWTPFTPLKNGDWSALILFSLTYLIQGFLLESWNYASGTHIGGKTFTYNPAYWAYSIPFVDRFHIFEMPVLGYLGYVPFGVYCWIWWISISFLLNIPTDKTLQVEIRSN